MALPPPKKTDPYKPKPKPAGGPPGAAPAPGGPAGPPPAPMGGMGGPPQMGPPPGMPKPGMGVDPMAAMFGGAGPHHPSFPPGPGGLPVGGSMPPMGPEGMDDAGSPLIAALMGSMGGGGMGGGQDPYSLPPGGPDHVFDGVQAGDPSMGLMQLLQLLALSQGGVGPGFDAPTTGGAGSSGVGAGGFGGMGQMMGF